MPDYDANVEILLNFIAQTQGAEAAHQAMLQLKESTSEVGRETEHTGEHAREMHHVFRELNQLAPGLGHVMKGIFHPEALGIILLLVALEQLVEHLKKAKEEAKEAAKVTQESFIKAAEAATEFDIQSKEATAAFAAELKKLADEQTSVAAGVDLVTEHIKQQKEELLLLSKAREEGAEKQKEIEVEALEAAAAAAATTATTAGQRQLHAVATRATAEQAFMGPEGDQLRKDIADSTKYLDELRAKQAKGGLSKDDADALAKSIATQETSIAVTKALEKALKDAFEAARKGEAQAQEDAEKRRAAVAPAEQAAALARAGLTLGQAPELSGVVTRGVEAIAAARENAGKVSQQQGQAIAGLHGFLEAIGMANKATIDALMRGQKDAAEMARQIDRLNRVVNQGGRNQ